jgi:hypothetical protein
MGAVLDLFRVLYEPAAVFERVREKPHFWAPALTLIVIGLIIAILLRPFYSVAFEAARSHLTPQQLERAPSAATQAMLALAIVPVNTIVGLLIGALFLWICVSVLGGEAKYKTLLSVLAYANVTFVLYSVITLVVLEMRGPSSVAAMADLRPALGLDLLYTGDSTFLSVFLNSINPFTIGGIWLAGLGISVTHRISRNTGYAATAIAFLLGSLLLSGLASLQPGS